MRLDGLSHLWPEVNFPFVLAPMVGLSHVALRSLIQSYLPSNAQTIWPTEMLNSRRLPNQKVGETPETMVSESDKILVPQILGNNESFIFKSLKQLEKINIRGVDINMGCPVQKALKHNYGVALMGDPKYAAEVVAMTKRSTTLPVSVKLRVGFQKDVDFFFKFCEGLEKAGVDLISLHPRTAEQKRKGHADWAQIGNLKERVSVPVIGNGDIQVYQDALRMLEETSCDGVMIGRALTGRPWMLWQIGEKLGFKAPLGREGERAPQTLEEEAYEYGKALRKFCAFCFQYFEPDYANRKIKFYLRVSSVWLNFGHALSKKLGKCVTVEEYSQVIDDFFEKSGMKFSNYTILNY